MTTIKKYGEEFLSGMVLNVGGAVQKYFLNRTI